MSTPKRTHPEIIYDILTLFPKMFKGVFEESILKRAQQQGIIEINIHNLRKWAKDKNVVDDKPYGGGVGMVLKPEPIFAAVRDLQQQFYQGRKRPQKEVSHVVLTTARGRRYNHRIAKKLSQLQHLIIICGHYEGVDHRVFEYLANERLSIGDYILTGGEIPAMVIVDSTARLIKGVLGKEISKEEESFNYTHRGLLKYPVYTRPEELEGMRVPEVLLSGHHQEIENWRRREAERLTREYRPDLLQ